MKFLLFASCIVLFGRVATDSSSVDDTFQHILREINQLKINDEAMKKDYNEKIKSCEVKNANYDEKIKSLEQQLGSKRNLGLQPGNSKTTWLFPSIHQSQRQLIDNRYFESFSVEIPVAFSTRLTDDKIINDSPVIFDVVDLNIEDGYDEFTGEKINTAFK